MFKDYFSELKNLEVYEEQDGFVLYKIEDDSLYIRDIYVKPDFRKSGLAAKMADTLAEYAKTLGCVRMIGDVEPSNNNATDSIKVLIAYGMKVAVANDDEILFVKEI